MGASESREGRLDDSDEEETSSESGGSYHSAKGVKGAEVAWQKAKLYHYIAAGTPKARWIVAEKLASWEFTNEDGDEEEDEDERMEESEASAAGNFKSWLLCISRRVRAKVDQRLQMKFFEDQLRVDFVFQGVWALKFGSAEDYKDFSSEYHSCLFENTYQIKATEENKMKVFGKDFIGWLKPQEADEAIWEDAEDVFDYKHKQQNEDDDDDLTETYNQVLNEGIRNLTLGALKNSFLVSDTRIEAYRNTPTGLQDSGTAVKFNVGSSSSSSKVNSSSSNPFATPKKAMLIKGESNMMVLTPTKEGKPHASNVQQYDLESGKTVTEWRFQKDGTDICMRDVTNDSKGAQLDPSLSTFLGLDDNRLCRWDMRDKHGIVQSLDWNEGHQFSRGTNFQCFASTGDGAVVVGSKDGKIRLYGKTSMRQAKTCFPGLGSPITHVDVSYDGHWILGTTDTYLILISALFIDKKDGKMKTGFTGRMGNKIAAPRLLKLTPVDSHSSGKNSKFHEGHFSWVTESGKQERHLVVSVGKFTVVWDFKRVKQSNNHECYKGGVEGGLKSCYCYKILHKEESIVDSKFMHDNFNAGKSPEAPLVIATPNNISSFNI